MLNLKEKKNNMIWKRRARASVRLEKNFDQWPNLRISITEQDRTTRNVVVTQQFSLDLGTAQQLVEKLNARIAEVQANPDVSYWYPKG